MVFRDGGSGGSDRWSVTLFFRSQQIGIDEWPNSDCSRITGNTEVTPRDFRLADKPSQNSDANLARRLSVQYPALMIRTVAIQGYRSLRDLVLPLGQLTVITGANGSGKSSVYRSLRLRADVAQNVTLGTLRFSAGNGGTVVLHKESQSQGG